MSIFKRKLKNGYTWRAVVRIKGYPTLCETFERKQEAEDWEKETKSRIKQGQFKFDQYKKQHTYRELIDRYLSDGALEHHRSAEDTLRHLKYWKERLGAYALVHITPELLGKERQLLFETPTAKEKKRSASTVNRYLASLSSSMSYASKRLRWINESPCTNLMKLKENAGRDRILSQDEVNRLLDSCRNSRSPYLYCIVLIALSTGARQGEILNLAWQHIDFTNGLAFIKETKNGRPRSIALEIPIIDELKRLYALRDPLKLLIFASRTAFGRIDIKKSWNQALERAGISNCRFHDMRHTFATNVAILGASNLELKALMGHRTLQMLQRYTHLEGQMTRKFNKTICSQLMGDRNE
jgi:integrase